MSMKLTHRTGQGDQRSETSTLGGWTADGHTVSDRVVQGHLKPKPTAGNARFMSPSLGGDEGGGRQEDWQKVSQEWLALRLSSLTQAGAHLTL